MKMKEFGRRNIITVAIALVGTLLVVSTFSIFQNRKTVIRNNIIRKESDTLVSYTNALVSYYLHNLDLGIRAYGATGDEEMKGPMEAALVDRDSMFHTLEVGLQAQSYDVTELRELQREFEKYGDYCLEMAALVKVDSMKTFREMLSKNEGLRVWLRWNDIGVKIINFEKKMNKEAENEYQAALDNNLYLQFFILLIGLPTLMFVITKIKKDTRERIRLLKELELNNRQYVFNPGEQVEFHSQEEVIEHSIRNFQNASEFIDSISHGEYTITWPELNEGNQSLNENNLAGRLTKMRDQLRQFKKEEEKRLWSNEGLTKFSEIVRNHQQNLVELSNEIVRFLSKYLQAQQCGLFILNDTGEKPYLELKACYAYDRKKFAERKIDIGIGLVGQAYLEGETTLLTKVPKGYTYITSGIGETSPSCVLILPMKYNDKIEAIIELASLKKFEEHEIAFLEKAGEFVAAAVQGVRTTERMHTLLSTSQEQTEAMRAQEEEMRQNMEELYSTQEEIQRREQEAAQRILQLEEEQKVLQLKLRQEARLNQENELRNQALANALEKLKEREEMLVRQLQQKQDSNGSR
jgi:putative methionine-R-sulfoxide reductase with GAF domain